jgi:hypothetical protein
VDPLLDIIPGDAPQRNLNRQADIHKNIQAVRAEFVGKPEICHAIVSNIIHLRRNPENWEHRAQFWERLHHYEDILLEHMDVRWLLSICDTIVDIGDHVQSATAMNIVQCINRCNLDTTILVNCADGRLDGNRLAHEIKVPTWGGMITADVPTGDMIYNMQTRLDTVIARDPQLNRIWCRIKDLSRTEHNVVMNHICKASRFDHQRRFFL